LLDNAIYWTKVRQELEGGKRPRAIRVLTQHRDDDGSSLIAVIDNGSGFSNRALAKARTAFFSERPNGTGLGLYFASMVTEQIGGMLTLSNADELREELDVPKALDGAAVVLRFGGK
jgi:nitrogen fixation/metabolism regulation signal transduction histidine kinase